MLYVKEIVVFGEFFPLVHVAPVHAEGIDSQQGKEHRSRPLFVAAEFEDGPGGDEYDGAAYQKSTPRFWKAPRRPFWVSRSSTRKGWSRG